VYHISGPPGSPWLGECGPAETFSTPVPYRDGLPIRYLVYMYNIRVTRVSLTRGMRPRWNMKHISIIRRWVASICIQVYQGHKNFLVSRYEAPLKQTAHQSRTEIGCQLGISSSSSLMTKNLLVKFFKIICAFYFLFGPHEGHLCFRKSLQPSKEKIRLLKKT
jgi:hypothetical protein